MTQGYGFILRASAFAMLCFCAAFGVYILVAGDPGSEANGFIAGRVVTGLAAICLALFCTASVLVRLLLKRLTGFEQVFYPALGYVGAVGTAAFGAYLWNSNPAPYYLVAGWVVFGLGCIAGCVSTVALASWKFDFIARNAHPAADITAQRAYGSPAAAGLIAIPVVIAFVAWVMAIPLAADENAARSVAGHVLAGLAAICTCLIGLVASMVRQEQGSYGEVDRQIWPWGTAAIGLACMVAGMWVLATESDPLYLAPAWVLPGLGLVCWSILSKIWLLAATWRRTSSWATHIPLIPPFTAVACFFMAAFLFQAEMHVPALFIPARVVAGLGAICFTLFSIVSLLESGTSRE
jgi:hypothetical protein